MRDAGLLYRLRAIVTKLNREIVRIPSEPDAKQRWTPIGLQPQPTTPEGIRQTDSRRCCDVYEDCERGEYQGGLAALQCAEISPRSLKFGVENGNERLMRS